MAGIAVMTAVAYGWGRAARRLAGMPGGTWPVTSALGLGTLLFLGGLLNLFRLAYPAALAFLVVAGLGLAVAGLWRHGAWRNLPSPPARAWGLLVLAVTGLACATQLEPRHYNTSDDYGNFFPHVMRMLETGTLYGSPLNALGAEVFGGQAFLQGFVAGFFPFSFLNAFDAVFCFFLTLAVAGSVAFERKQLWPGAMTAALAIAIIDPEYVNVSSLYSTAALMAALAVLSADPRERGDGTGWHSALAPALLYAGLIALKHTGLVFAGLHWAAMAAAIWRMTGSRRNGLLHGLRTASLAALFLAPWLLLYAPYYWIAIMHPLADTGIHVPDATFGQKMEGLLSLLSPAERPYGGSLLAYSAIATGLILCSLAAIKRNSGDLQERLSQAGLAATAIAAAMTYLSWVIYGPRLQELDATLRYAIPFLIGGCAAALPLWLRQGEKRGSVACLLVAALLLAGFATSARHRWDMLARNGTQLAFLRHWDDGKISSDYRYQQWALNGDAQRMVRNIQQAVPQGETILAWSGLSFLLDFGRNKVIDMNVAGMGQPWGHIPAAHYAFLQFAPPVVPSDNQLYASIYRTGRRSARFDARAVEVKAYFQNLPESDVLLRKEDIEMLKLDGTGLK
jgi:hypothetical protein